jgi:tetratricopeptide (TPR) repeat protein
MKVSFQLRRTAHAQPAEALLFTESAEPILTTCERLCLDHWPAIHMVADGFLLRLPRPSTISAGGAIRLRSLAPHLWIPVDSVLVPGLLDDEARGLVRDRGLVFLPGGRVLEYATGVAVLPSELLRLDTLGQSALEPLPSLRALASSLEITGPEAGSVDEVLEEGGADIGLENPLDDRPGLGRKLRSALAYGTGGFLAKLGQALNIKNLTKMGAGLMGRGMSGWPTLSQALLGRQEAALRALLREFRLGNVEKALRRALPLDQQFSDRGARPAANSILPFHNFIYSLRNLLGLGSGPAQLWFVGSGDIVSELTAQYRRQAEKAASSGDFRRAAYIYAKLLGDFRAAASVLERGGLFRDAAVIYLEKVGDPLAAARAYEAGGLFDLALELYRKSNQHVLAGDLLARLGEEENAVSEYELTAGLLVERGQHYQAGDLILAKTKRADLALAYFEAGWAKRPGGSAVPCAIRIAQLHAREAHVQALLQIVVEAANFLVTKGADSQAGEFYNEIVRLAQGPELEEARSELSDRALMALASRIKRRVATQTAGKAIVSNLLGANPAWPSPLVSDANYAVRAAIRQARKMPLAKAGDFKTVTLPASVRQVTAVAYAAETGLLYVGFAGGDVVGFTPASGEIVIVQGRDHARPFLEVSPEPPASATDPIVVKQGFGKPAHLGLPVHSLVTTCRGDRLAVLQKPNRLPGRSVRTCWFSHDVLVRVACQEIEDKGGVVLLPEVDSGAESFGGIWDGRRIILELAGASPDIFDVHVTPPEISEVLGGLLQSSDNSGSKSAFLIGPTVIWHYGNVLKRRAPKSIIMSWIAGAAEGSAVRQPVISWRRQSALDWQLAGIDAQGCLHFVHLSTQPKLTLVSHRIVPGETGEGFQAAAFVGSAVVAGVTTKAIKWIRAGERRPLILAVTNLDLASPVAAFYWGAGNELLVVCSAGEVVRVPVPDL